MAWASAPPPTPPWTAPARPVPVVEDEAVDEEAERRELIEELRRLRMEARVAGM